MTIRYVAHSPVWQPADLPINADGDTRPGFVCVRELENGNGQCGGNVFAIDEAIGDHGCIADDYLDLPEGCASCGAARQGHGTRWIKGVGWHAYEQPCTELIEARMRARFDTKETPA